MADPVLKHCPFCGGVAGFEEVKGAAGAAWSVGCTNNAVDCIVQLLASFARKGEAAEAWNKRAKGPVDMPSYPYLSVALKHVVDYALVLRYVAILNANIMGINPEHLDDKHRMIFGDVVVAWRKEKERVPT